MIGGEIMKKYELKANKKLLIKPSSAKANPMSCYTKECTADNIVKVCQGIAFVAG